MTGSVPNGSRIMVDRVARECIAGGLDEEHVYEYAVNRFCEERVRLGDWNVIKCRQQMDELWEAVVNKWLFLKNGRRVKVSEGYVSEGYSDRGKYARG